LLMGWILYSNRRNAVFRGAFARDAPSARLSLTSIKTLNNVKNERLFSLGQVNQRVFPSMAGKLIAKVTSVLLASLLISACGGALGDNPPVFSPASSKQENIRAVLLAYEEAWNRQEEPSG
jgi:hypothetical protein